VVAIIAILAAMLLPALAAAREKARRAVCVNNLNQAALALMSYTSDYSEYFPSWPEAGGIDRSVPYASSPQFIRGAAMYKDQRTGQQLCGRPSYPEHFTTTGDIYYHRGRAFNWRSIGVAFKAQSSSTESVIQADWVGDGRLNMVPVNMGITVDCGYVADMRSFYCPSAMAAPDRAMYDSALLQSLDEMSMVGKTWDRNHLLFGNYSVGKKGTTFGSYPAARCANVRSRYNYRNAALVTYVGASTQWNMRLDVPFTKPKLRTWNGAPCFGTQKLLAGRALLSDTWEKPHSTLSSDAYLNFDPGAALYTHKDGYNVVYGDGHGAWYGDPERRIMYYGPLQVADYTNPNSAFIVPKAYRTSTTGGYDIWHRFDMREGVDLDAPTGDYMPWSSGMYDCP